MKTAPNRCPIRWLVFDVLGTCVEWRSSLARESAVVGEQWGLKPRGGWNHFSTKWVGAYAHGVAEVSSTGVWRGPDTLIRQGLSQTMTHAGGTSLSRVATKQLCAAWKRLDPWPDVVPALKKIRQREIRVATLSNFGSKLLADMADHSGLPWDRFLSSETVQRYKPDPAVYRMTVEELDVTPAGIMMVAAHSYDLEAARALGFQTAFVTRPAEEPSPKTHRFDIVATDFDDLVTQIATG